MSGKGADKNAIKEIDYVAQGKDWRGVIENELRCAENWNKDWGFLAEMNCKIIILIINS